MFLIPADMFPKEKIPAKKLFCHILIITEKVKLMLFLYHTPIMTIVAERKK